MTAADPFETLDSVCFGQVERPLVPVKTAVQGLSIVSIMVLYCSAGYIRHPCQDAAKSQRGPLHRLVQSV
jgi:hypothetical protein